MAWNDQDIQGLKHPSTSLHRHGNRHALAVFLMATISWERQQSGLDQKDRQMFKDVILAAAESFDCSVIQLSHTVMSPHDDYTGSDDEGSAGSVLILKRINACSTHS